MLVVCLDKKSAKSEGITIHLTHNLFLSFDFLPFKHKQLHVLQQFTGNLNFSFGP